MAGLGEPADPGNRVYYFSRYQSPVPFGTILARMTGDPATLAAALMSAALLFVATLASLIPAQRALRMNPVAALRHE